MDAVEGVKFFFLTAGCFWLVLQSVWIHILKSRHIEVWEELDRPGIMLQAKSQWKIIKYFLRRKYRETKDPVFIWACVIFGVYCAIYLVLFFSLVIFLISILIYMKLSGQ